MDRLVDSRTSSAALGTTVQEVLSSYLSGPPEGHWLPQKWFRALLGGRYSLCDSLSSIRKEKKKAVFSQESGHVFSLTKCTVFDQKPNRIRKRKEIMVAKIGVDTEEIETFTVSITDLSDHSFDHTSNP